MGYYTPIPGTWAWNDLPKRPLGHILGSVPQWYAPKSYFTRTLERLGHCQLWPDDPFYWSTDLGGLFGLGRFLRGWKAAGANLRQRVQEQRVALQRRNFIAHSYGGCVLAFAAYNGLRMNTVITVGTPHHDQVPWQDLIQACDRWLIIEDVKGDRMNRLGEWFDRLPGFADPPTHRKVLTLRVPNIDHSKCLNGPEHVDAVWEREGAASWLDMPPAATQAQAHTSL